MPRKDRRWTMSEPEMKSLLTTMKTVGHEALAHDLFFDCFPELGSVMQMGGMKTTSLFRMALLYFLFVPDARDQSSGEHQVQVRSISEPIGGGPAGMDAKALGFLVAVPAGIFGALFLVAWALRTRKH